MLIAALWVSWAGITWGTWVAGGADPYGYVSQAGLWLQGDLIVEQPMADELDWPEVDATLAPLGYRPGPRLGTIVPIYPAGLPIVMAAFQLVAGSRAVFLVVPLLGALAVLVTAGLARRVAGPTAGAFAAILLGTSPTLIYSATWPMSDLAAGAWWALALYGVTRAGPGWAAVGGGATALAVLTRPNLVGVAVAPLVYLGVRAVRSRTRTDVTRLVLYSALTGIGCLAVAGIHTVLYGGPLESGHGNLSQFFETTRRSYNPTGPLLRPLLNLRGYLTRPFDVEPLLVVTAAVGAVAVLRPAATATVRGVGALCLGMVAAVLASYLFFRSFPEWWYLRLFLPAFPALAVLGGVGTAWVFDRIRDPFRPALVAYALVVASVFGVYQVVARKVPSVSVVEARYESVGRFVAQTLPENAALLAFQQSGSLRYYADRLTIRFDLMHGEWLEPATELLRDRGYVPYFVVEESETTLFQERFGGHTGLGRLDWPALAELQSAPAVRIFDPADRQRALSGEAVVTRQIPLVGDSVP